jgi:hypothetical protein
LIKGRNDFLQGTIEIIEKLYYRKEISDFAASQKEFSDKGYLRAWNSGFSSFIEEYGHLQCISKMGGRFAVLQVLQDEQSLLEKIISLSRMEK